VTTGEDAGLGFGVDVEVGWTGGVAITGNGKTSTVTGRRHTLNDSSSSEALAVTV
jgi:hypothetical protein